MTMELRVKRLANGGRENAIDNIRAKYRRVTINRRTLEGGRYSRSRSHRRNTTTDRELWSGAGLQQRNKPLRGGKGKDHGAAEQQFCGGQMGQSFTWNTRTQVNKTSRRINRPYWQVASTPKNWIQGWLQIPIRSKSQRVAIHRANARTKNSKTKGSKETWR